MQVEKTAMVMRWSVMTAMTEWVTLLKHNEVESSFDWLAVGDVNGSFCF